MIKRTRNENKKSIFDDLTWRNIGFSFKIFSLVMIYLGFMFFKIILVVGKYSAKLFESVGKKYEHYGEEKKTRKIYKKQKRGDRHGYN